jgi:hypothetical protein
LYKVIDLESFDTPDRPLAINDAGWVVGIAGTDAAADAVLWSPSGKLTVLQDLGGVGDSGAFAINDAGWSVGAAANAGSIFDAMLWSPSGKETVLQDVGGELYSVADDINDAGWSVGESWTAWGTDAVLWSPTGKGTALQDAGLQGFSGAVAINDAGWSVGYSFTAALGRSALTDRDAVLWSPSGKATVLQDAGGLGYSAAVAINDSGWSVGNSWTPGGAGPDAVLWSPTGQATNLNTILGSGWSETEATGINNEGDIVGWGSEHDQFSAFLLLHVSGASLTTFDAVNSHTDSATLAAVHDHLGS